MNKLIKASNLVDFARFLGFQINEADVKVLGEDTSSQAQAQVDADEDEADADVQPAADAGKTGEATLNAAPPPPQPQAQPAAAPQAQTPPPPPASSNLALLDSLITQIGGFEQFKALLLAFVEAQSAAQPEPPAPPQAQPYANAKRAELVKEIVANAEGKFTAGSFEGVDDMLVERVHDAIMRPVRDFSVLGIQRNRANDKGEDLPLPSVLLRANAKQETK